MTIKQLGGVFGRNPEFNDLSVDGDVTVGDVDKLTPNGDKSISISGVQGSEVIVSRPATSYSGGEFIGGFAFLNLDSSNTPPHYTGIKAVAENAFGQTNLEIHSGLETYDTGGTPTITLHGSTKDATLHSGNLIIGTSGKGIDFSATAGTGTSELFDDYEEGTWTPVVADASAGGNTATGTFTGTYTKIGRMVTLNAVLVDINTSGMTGGNILYLRNLPFVTTTGHIGSNLMRSVTYSGQIAPRTLDGLSYLYFMEYSSGSATSVLTVGGISSGVADIWFTVTYEV